VLLSLLFLYKYCRLCPPIDRIGPMQPGLIHGGDLVGLALVA
jgi:hypothetical protein